MNLHVISGVIRLNKEQGQARIDFSQGSIFGDASFVEIRGSGRDFRRTPHAIVSPTDLTLSTHSNTFYRVNRSVNREALNISWRVDSAGLRLQVDFLVIGEI